MDEDIKIILAEVKYDFLKAEDALAKIKAIIKKELEKVLEWGCRQGYDPEPGIIHKIEIFKVAYTIPEAIEIYLKTIQS